MLMFIASSMAPCPSPPLPASRMSSPVLWPTLVPGSSRSLLWFSASELPMETRRPPLLPLKVRSSHISTSHPTPSHHSPHFTHLTSLTSGLTSPLLTTSPHLKCHHLSSPRLISPPSILTPSLGFVDALTHVVKSAQAATATPHDQGLKTQLAAAKQKYDASMLLMKRCDPFTTHPTPSFHSNLLCLSPSASSLLGLVLSIPTLPHSCP